jgi:glycosyltransferase involved in cell wall biosynthesis
MEYFFLGSIYDAKSEAYLLKYSKSGLQAASNQYQWGLINGLQNVLKTKMTVVSSYPVGAFPRKNSKLFYKGFLKEINEFLKINYVGFINFYLIKDFWRLFKYQLYFSKKINKDRNYTVFVYGLDLAFVWTVIKCKRKFKDKLKIILIVPDIPGEFGILRSKYTLEGCWDRLFVEKKMNMANYADGFVLLTDHMKDVIKVNNKPYCVVEGFLPTEIEKKDNLKLSDKKVILYTGSLNIQFGIVELVKAFNLINDSNYQLWICGVGDGVSFVKEQALINSNIIYHGYVNKVRINQLQQMATILINPRRDEGVYTRYSFPSKTIEYLTTGKPIVMYKLSGIPEEYDDYIFYVKDDKIEDLKDEIIEVCSLSTETLFKFGQNARKWVLEEKNNIKQAQKVKELLTIIENKNYN